MTSQETSAISTLSSLQQMRPDVQPFSIPGLLSPTPPQDADQAALKRSRKRKSAGEELDSSPAGPQKKTPARRGKSREGSEEQSPGMGIMSVQDLLHQHQRGEFAEDDEAGGETQDYEGEEGKIDGDDEQLSAAKRKEMHKEVERKRRDNINSGILELAKIVPDCEKSKSSVVHKSVEYIRYLQKTNLLTIERWKDERKEAEDKMRSLFEELGELRRENLELRSRLGMEPRNGGGPQ